MKPRSTRVAALAMAAFAIVTNLQAAPITKAATGTDLTAGASWGGTAPGSGDVATWASTSLGAGLTLATSRSWSGINPAVWVNSAAAGSWANSTSTNQYGLPGDYLLAGGTWANVVSTNLSRTVTGLAPNTTYYFTFCATNRTVSGVLLTNVQTLWAANVQSFTTLASVPPTPVLLGSAITFSNTVPSFTFGTTAGYTYRLVYKHTLTNIPWLPVIAPPAFPLPEGWSSTSSGVPMSLSDTNTGGQPQRFYRLEAANP